MFRQFFVQHTFQASYQSINAQKGAKTPRNRKVTFLPIETYELKEYPGYSNCKRKMRDIQCALK